MVSEGKRGKVASLREELREAKMGLLKQRGELERLHWLLQEAKTLTTGTPHDGRNGNPD